VTVRRGVPREKRPRRQRGEDAEETLATALLLCGSPLADFERQYHYVPGRKFAADFGWATQRLLVELQGGIFQGVSHGAVSGMLRDIERLNLATLHGWRLLRFVPSQIADDQIGETIELIEQVLLKAQGAAV